MESPQNQTIDPPGFGVAFESFYWFQPGESASTGQQSAVCLPTRNPSLRNETDVAAQSN
jgi:hypothetical protein